MALPYSPERRTSVRHPMMGELPGQLIDFESLASIKALAVNVSREGLGIITFERLEIGRELIFVKGDLNIVLTVIWCNADNASAKSFSCGLSSKSPDLDLRAVFIAHQTPSQSETEAWLASVKFVPRHED